WVAGSGGVRRRCRIHQEGVYGLTRCLYLPGQPGALAWVVGDAPAARDALAKFSWKSPAVVVKVLDSVLRGIAQVAFGNNPISGLLILIAAGHSNFNAVLIGTVSTALYPLVFHTPLSPAVWGYIIVAAMFTVCVMAGLGRILEGHNIPAYTLPFNIAISTTFLCMKAAGFGEEASPAPSEEPDTGLQWDQVFLGTLLSAGHVWAVESVACSVLVLLGLFIFSPTLTLVSYLGATLGTLTGLVVSSAPYTLVYHGIWGYNGFLAAGSIAFFMAPTPRVILVAAINAVFATYLQAALIPVYAANGLPVFTFPFCLASVLFLATAMAMGPSTLRVTSPSFPELHLVQYNQKSRIVATKDNRDGDETTTEPMV
ncbi:Urea transporter 1-like 1, partial [Homarus americanus]